MQGKISQIMGAVVDVKFPEGNLPKIMNALKITKKSVTSKNSNSKYGQYGKSRK